MIKDWKDHTDSLSGVLKDMRGGMPETSKAFSQLAASASKAGAIDAKTKELLALAISIATRCDDCIGFHTKALVKLGATEEEIVETIGIAVYMGGGPSMMYGAHAFEAFKQFAEG